MLIRKESIDYLYRTIWILHVDPLSSRILVLSGLGIHSREHALEHRDLLYPEQIYVSCDASMALRDHMVLPLALPLSQHDAHTFQELILHNAG